MDFDPASDVVACGYCGSSLRVDRGSSSISLRLLEQRLGSLEGLTVLSRAHQLLSRWQRSEESDDPFEIEDQEVLDEESDKDKRTAARNERASIEAEFSSLIPLLNQLLASGSKAVAEAAGRALVQREIWEIEEAARKSRQSVEMGTNVVLFLALFGTAFYNFANGRALWGWAVLIGGLLAMKVVITLGRVVPILLWFRQNVSSCNRRDMLRRERERFMSIDYPALARAWRPA